MKDIIFNAPFGAHERAIRISFYWTDTYYLYIDDFLTAIISNRGNAWFMTDQRDELFTATDLGLISALIESQQAQPANEYQ
ncbi:hypothetical protein [Pedobacter zeae]|uniref:Uncharacterized protein n=1 Tax=Pedobacter zeae TaxID=1737356 RepID=A0A7W6K7J3_9SPHI|nr:hypothetical protein [Pedobacter zeae]MBB4106634.1 hypothetical protein [Pedobacter zeae]GGH02864.1 hypothetical protein GCM10007422_17540 [Pedobacter zeae]